MKVLLKSALLAAAISACGTDMKSISTVQNNEEEEIELEEEFEIIEMCQLYADPVKPVDFKIEPGIIHFMACYDFRPCDPETPPLFSEEEIEDYAIGGGCYL